MNLDYFIFLKVDEIGIHLLELEVGIWGILNENYGNYDMKNELS